MKVERWVTRWRYAIQPNPVLPGVWRKKGGGFLIRARIRDPSTGSTRAVMRSVETQDAREAFNQIAAEEARLASPAPAPTQSAMRFCDWGVLLLERKIRAGDLRSQASIARWHLTLRDHLIPHFGTIEMGSLRRAHIERWKDHVAMRFEGLGARKSSTRRGGTDGERQRGRRRKEPKRQADTKYAPTTANGWLAILRVVVNGYVDEHELDRNPMRGVKPFDTRGHRTYTEEQPNALTDAEVGAFLDISKREFPQHHAMTLLGFTTALRPSSLRPLRASGPEADVLWNEGVLLIRRSHTVGQSVMNLTKTGRDQRIALPPSVMEVLRWHVRERLPLDCTGPTELLFPAEDGRLRSPSSLKKVFVAIAERLGLGKRITPRAMRRTFQDLARGVELRDVVTRSISGHATETMQRHYSTVAREEQRGGIARIAALAGVPEGPSGVKSGVKAQNEGGETTSAASGSHP